MAWRAGSGGPVSASDWPHGLSAGVVDEGVCEAGGVGVLAVELVELVLEELDDDDEDDDELPVEAPEEPLDESSGAGSRDPGGAVSSWRSLDEPDDESSPPEWLDAPVLDAPVLDEPELELLPLLQLAIAPPRESTSASLRSEARIIPSIMARPPPARGAAARDRRPSRRSVRRGRA
jgi:hypothetical protein